MWWNPNDKRHIFWALKVHTRTNYINTRIVEPVFGDIETTMALHEKWKGGDGCGSWCIAEEGSTSADACISLLLPCYTYASIQKKHDPSDSFFCNFMLFAIADSMGLACCLTCVTRAHINTKVDCCENCMFSCFCQPCALIQALKTIEPIATHDSGHSDGGTLSSDPLLHNGMQP